mgnify:CR=1 FL=1
MILLEPTRDSAFWSPLRSLLKGLVVAWTGFFLVLPCCPCQLLDFLGLGVEHRVTDFEATVFNTAHHALPECHCDDAPPSAEPMDWLMSTNRIFVGTWCGLHNDESLNLPGHRPTVACIRPPPPQVDSSFPLREVVCVYLI